MIADDLAAWANVSIEPAGSLAAEPVDLDAARSRETALRHRPDLAQLEADLDRRELASAYQRNQNLPQIDLVGSYGHAASSDEMAGAMDQVQNGSFPFYTVGLSVSVPLGNHRARESWRAGLAERDWTTDLVRQARQTVAIEVDNAVVGAQSSFERVASAGEARAFAEAALEAGEAKLATGNLRSFEALQLQRDLTSACAEEIRALADYNKALAILRWREGTTLRCLLGIFLGAGAARLIAARTEWPTLISRGSIVMAFAFSAAVGIFFGFYPARKASRLDPIEALRYE